MKPATASTAYGYEELRLVHHRYMMLAMLLAVTIQMLIIGGYRVAEWLKQNDHVETRPPVIMDIFRIPLPPPIGGIELPTVVPTLQPKAEYATPVPVPDFLADTMKTLGDQSRPSPQPSATDPSAMEGPVKIVGEYPLVDPDPSPDTFRPFQKEPIAVLRAAPEYPDLAKRVCLEGSVLVKVLVDKEGKVKNAILVKATEEIFSQPALDAARKWAFTPALMNGKPVVVWVSIPFRFRLAK